MVLDGEAGGSAARGDLELTIDGGQMPVDGARTDDQFSCHLGIGQSPGYQAQNIPTSRAVSPAG